MCNRSRFAGFVCVLSVAVAAGVHAAPTYDVVADFSISSNGGGVWAYGYSSTLTNLAANFTLYTNHSSSCWTGVECWNTPTGVPDVGKNTTLSTVNFATTVFLPVDQLHMHPYESTYSIVRWTAPSSHVYAFSGAWYVQDEFPQSVSLDIVGLGYSETFNHDPLGSSKPFSAMQYVAQGDSIYFAVGPNGSYYYDSTGLKLAIFETPEPAPAQLGLLAGCALVCLGRFRFRR